MKIERIGHQYQALEQPCTHEFGGRVQNVPLCARLEAHPESRVGFLAKGAFKPAPESRSACLLETAPVQDQKSC